MPAVGDRKIESGCIEMVGWLHGENTYSWRLGFVIRSNEEPRAARENASPIIYYIYSTNHGNGNKMMRLLLPATCVRVRLSYYLLHAPSKVTETLSCLPSSHVPGLWQRVGARGAENR